jgi:hypothetical protein
MNLSVEHVLMIVLVAFALHYFMGNCGCRVEGLTEAKRKARRLAKRPASKNDHVEVQGPFKNLGEYECCVPGDCADGLECDSSFLYDRNGDICMSKFLSGKWWGTCQKKN